MYRLLVHSYDDIKKIVKQHNTGAKEIQQLNPGHPTTDTTSGPNHLIYRKFKEGGEDQKSIQSSTTDQGHHMGKRQ